MAKVLSALRHLCIATTVSTIWSIDYSFVVCWLASWPCVSCRPGAAGDALCYIKVRVSWRSGDSAVRQLYVIGRWRGVRATTLKGRFSNIARCQRRHTRTHTLQTPSQCQSSVLTTNALGSVTKNYRYEVCTQTLSLNSFLSLSQYAVRLASIGLHGNSFKVLCFIQILSAKMWPLLNIIYHPTVQVYVTPRYLFKNISRLLCMACRPLEIYAWCTALSTA